MTDAEFELFAALGESLSVHSNGKVDSVFVPTVGDIAHGRVDPQIFKILTD
jgi:hypothetical protein